MPRLPVAVSTFVVVGFALLPGAAHGQQPTTPPPPPTITAIGTATIKPDPDDRQSNDSIREAVREAQVAVVPRSFASARARARSLAAAAGVTLGALQSISDVPPSPFGPFGGYGTEGTFGPGRYCGNVGRFRSRRLANGRIRRVRVGTRRVCRVPSQVSGQVSLTYAVVAQ